MTTVERYREAILRAVEMLRTVKRRDCIALADELAGIVTSGRGRRKSPGRRYYTGNFRETFRLATR